MRIVVSGTHASGKTTLIADFAAAHPEFEVLGDPFELVDGATEEPDAGTFFAQLRFAAARLADEDVRAQVIAERGALDFVAYLEALDALGRPTRSRELLRRGAELAAAAAVHVDLLVVLTPEPSIHVGQDEDPELRAAMHDALLELVDDGDLVGDAPVVELGGDPATRLAGLEAVLATLGR